MTMSYVNTLIYKRTHKGDPDESGNFGCYDCMGKIRSYNFDAVIGVGGKKPIKRDKDIALKINWIGLGPTKRYVFGKKGPLITFKHFCLYDYKGGGPALKTMAAKIFKYMFEDKNVRFVMSKNLPDNMQKEITKILRLAERCPPSKGLTIIGKKNRKCK